ncbi:YdeI family protein [uncultured Hymenobacter sp.]|uniref:YdeI/OmpD-associated family protein n=1 Tax=uncultured Hymenobacter sp. TaxID=170016 RepID=UPI0035CB48DA
MNPKVDFYFAKAKKWVEALEQLRTFVLDCGLSEELKWGVPCYTFQQRNIVLLHVFKDYCAILFFKGALLRDAQGLLVQQTANTQAARQLRFTTVEEVVAREAVIKAYLQEATEVEKKGLQVAFKNEEEFLIPAEFASKVAEDSALKTAFAALTPGRKRAYLLYFSAPKQPKTRESRIEKFRPQILSGRGLNE